MLRLHQQPPDGWQLENRLTKWFAAAALSAISLSVVPALGAGIGVGDKAPAVKVQKWVKGTPVETFEPGKLYVVEFWATWCGPCKTSIPHLTELAKKYTGKVTFAGVSVWERGADVEKQVSTFVTDMGAKMDYNVAIDTADGVMAKTWMEAAAQDGIPAAFIINGEGVITWIGHPMELEKPLEQVVAGKFDMAAAKKAFDAQAAKSRQEQAAYEKFQKAQVDYKAGKKKEAFAALDQIVKEMPHLATNVKLGRVNMMVADDPKGALALATSWMAGAKALEDAMALSQAAMMISNSPAFKAKPDWTGVLALSAKAVEVTKGKDVNALAMQAEVLGAKGDAAAAVAAMQKAMAVLAKSEMASNPQAKAFYQSKLDGYKAKLAAGKKPAPKKP